MTVRAILEQKGYHYVFVDPSTTITSVIETLSKNKIGAVPVCDKDGQLKGILSERDIIRALASQGSEILQSPASELMTRDVFVCKIADTVIHLMETMTRDRFRHVPVVQNKKLCGIISIGDVVKYRIKQAEEEAEKIKQYITNI